VDGQVKISQLWAEHLEMSMKNVRCDGSCRSVAAVLAVSGLWASVATAQLQDWSNVGGNGRTNGMVDVVGPDGAEGDNVLWQGGDLSFIAWHPVIEGRRVFMVRQIDFPPNPVPNDATIVAHDLDTGAVLWRADLPYEPGDWTTWIAGVKNGRVFAARSGNGGSVSSPLYCLDAATGQVLWSTAGTPPLFEDRYEVTGGPYAGAVFADDGDIIIPSPRFIDRVDGQTGARVWSVPRVEQVWNSSGIAINGNALYVVDLKIGAGNRLTVRRFNATTGAFLYDGPLMTGGLLENPPFIGPDGRIYISFAQNFNIQSDYLYSFTDEGDRIVQNWRTSANGGGAFSRWSVGRDGSVYSMEWTGTQDFAAEGRLQRLDPATGEVIGQTAEPITADYMQIHMAVDQRGVLYVSNGNAGGLGGGRLYSFNPDLSLRWSIPMPGNLNQGGPALGTDGTLVIASTDNNVFAFRTPRSVRCSLADVFGGSEPGLSPDGTVDGSDFIAFINSFAIGDASVDALADVAGAGDDGLQPDGTIDGSDFIAFINAFAVGC
jgi:outer membrane protein assembly factor BamB